MYCTNCGAEIEDGSTVCPRCGENLQELTSVGSASKNWMIAICCNMFFGTFGAHRFYTGHIGLGIAQLLTLGGLGFWSFVDGILLAFNLYKDSDGNELEGYNMPAGIMCFVCKMLYNLLKTLISILYVLFFVFAIIAGVASAGAGSY